MRTEITTRSGHGFAVENGSWQALDPSDQADNVIAEVFEKLCQHEGGECLGGGIPDVDYCYALLVTRRYGGKITKIPKFQPIIKGRLY